MMFDWGVGLAMGAKSTSPPGGSMDAGDRNCKKNNAYRKVKSAVALCVGILVCTAVLFVLDPSEVAEDPRLLVTFPYRIRKQIGAGGNPALEGLGTLLRKGRRAMPDLVVAHLTENTTPDDLRLFLRGLHRSGTPARADVVLLFPRRPVPPQFVAVVDEEETYFQRLLAAMTTPTEDATLSVFNSGAYTHVMSDIAKQESIWGNRSVEAKAEALREPHFGAIVGFDMQELDPDDTLSGFLDSSPAVLRRWLCYQILLGIVRHRYTHVMLTEVSGVFVFRDALQALKRKDSSLHLVETGQRWSDPSMERVYGKSVEAEDRDRKLISTGVIMGGTRLVRTLATAMATEIVRVALERQSRTPFRTDSPFLSFLVHKSSVLGKKVATHLQVHDRSASAVNILRPGSDDFFQSGVAIIQGLKNAGVPTEMIMTSLRRDMCRSHRDIQIYADCFMTIANRLCDNIRECTCSMFTACEKGYELQVFLEGIG